MSKPKGLSFPVRFGPLGHLERAEGAQKIRENLEHLMQTRKGDRPMSPRVGTLNMAMVFRDLSYSNAVVISDELGKCVAQWEPRVSVRRIDVTSDPNTGEAIVSSTYRFRGMSGEDDLTFTMEG